MKSGEISFPLEICYNPIRYSKLILPSLMENPHYNKMDSYGNARGIRHVITDKAAPLKQLGWQFQGSTEFIQRAQRCLFARLWQQALSLNCFLGDPMGGLPASSQQTPLPLMIIPRRDPTSPNSQDHASLPMLLFLNSFTQVANIYFCA